MSLARKATILTVNNSHWQFLGILANGKAKEGNLLVKQEKLQDKKKQLLVFDLSTYVLTGVKTRYGFKHKVVLPAELGAEIGR